jgi:D-3-phosphoglycerate dehydrogenase
MIAMRQWKVLITAPRAVDAIERFEAELGAAECEVVVARSAERLEEEDLLPIVGDIHAVICGDDRISRRVLDAAPNLRVISKWGTGIDSIDVAEARSRGIAVCNTPGAFSDPVADTVLGYVLLFARQLDRMAAEMKAGSWRRIELRSLRECTLGIIGLGQSGRAVAARATAFGMRVLSYTLKASLEEHEDPGVELVPLNELLTASDFVTLHADLRPDNRHLIDDKCLRLMKPTSVLINTARGALVDEEALTAALREQRIGGAALDVFETEPLPADSPLRSLANVYLAPHNANASSSAADRVHANSIKNVLRNLEAPARSHGQERHL